MTAAAATELTRATLDRLLRNEADMSAKHRVRVVLEYLDVKPGERVLDCGCGYGWFLKVLGELYACRLVGADVDLRRLEKARQELGRPGGAARGAAVLAADAGRLPFPDDTFDKIVLSEVLEHLPDDRAALLEVRRVLKPGGVIAITVPNRDYPILWDPINWLRERLGLAPIRHGVFGGIWTDHRRLYRRDEIARLVRDARLDVEDTRGLVHYCFPFSHNLVYGLGKPLVEGGLLAGADRFRYAENRGSPWSPLNLGRRVFNAIDRLNDPASATAGTTVVIGVKARKPGGDRSGHPGEASP
jgi:SAM-dependent methyltransferase